MQHRHEQDVIVVRGRNEQQLHAHTHRHRHSCTETHTHTHTSNGEHTACSSPNDCLSLKCTSAPNKKQWQHIWRHTCTLHANSCDILWQLHGPRPWPWPRQGMLWDMHICIQIEVEQKRTGTYECGLQAITRIWVILYLRVVGLAIPRRSAWGAMGDTFYAGAPCIGFRFTFACGVLLF